MNPRVTSLDLRIIEDVLEMGGGYVLDFTNRTFAEFFSERGVNIYDDRFSEDGDSKAKRLRCFLRQAEPPQLGQILADLLHYRSVVGACDALPEERLDQYRQIVSRVGGDLVCERAPAGDTPETEAALLAHAFQPDTLRGLPFIQAELSQLLVERMEQAGRCIEAEAYLPAVILCGSVLEGLCLGVGSHQAERVNRGYQSLYSKSAPRFPEWKLSEWIAVLERLGDLSPNIAKFGHALREFRNYVHPYQQLATRFVPDQHTARISFHVVAAAVDDLAAAHGAAP